MTLSFFVPTVCRLPPQTIVLIVMGAFAIVVALFGAMVTFIDGIIVIWTRWNTKQIKRYGENEYENGRGEVCLCYSLEELGL